MLTVCCWNAGVTHSKVERVQHILHQQRMNISLLLLTCNDFHFNAKMTVHQICLHAKQFHLACHLVHVCHRFVILVHVEGNCYARTVTKEKRHAHGNEDQGTLAVGNRG
jgi:hypothetical protein